MAKDITTPKTSGTVISKIGWSAHSWDRIFVNLRNLWMRDEGQDLVEYALVVALIAFGAIGGMEWLSNQIATKFLTLAGGVEYWVLFR